MRVIKFGKKYNKPFSMKVKCCICHTKYLIDDIENDLLIDKFGYDMFYWCEYCQSYNQLSEYEVDKIDRYLRKIGKRICDFGFKTIDDDKRERGIDDDDNDDTCVDTSDKSIGDDDGSLEYIMRTSIGDDDGSLGYIMRILKKEITINRYDNGTSNTGCFKLYIVCESSLGLSLIFEMLESGYLESNKQNEKLLYNIHRCDRTDLHVVSLYVNDCGTTMNPFEPLESALLRYDDQISFIVYDESRNPSSLNLPSYDLSNAPCGWLFRFPQNISINKDVWNAPCLRMRKDNDDPLFTDVVELSNDVIADPGDKSLIHTLTMLNKDWCGILVCIRRK